MAIDIAINLLTKDLDLTGGRVNFTTVREEIIRQRIESALALITGEYFLDLGAGVDWLTLLRQKQLDPIQRAVTNVVLADVDVASASIQAERSGRAATVRGIARLKSGEEIEINVPIG